MNIIKLTMKIMYKSIIKPLFDFTFSFLGIIILLPIFILLIILLSFANNGKPFFFQLRPGLNGKIFKIIKFKTMNDKKDKNGNLLPDEIRLTKSGKFIRKTSLDEIPQLLNVIIGDMSLIGPRPLLPNYLNYYNDYEKKRHNIKPGITGLAAVNGRNNISWFDKMKFDIKYSEKISFDLDLKIFFKTILKILQSDGIEKNGYSTSDNFDDFCKLNPIRKYD